MLFPFPASWPLAYASYTQAHDPVDGAIHSGQTAGQPERTDRSPVGQVLERFAGDGTPPARPAAAAACAER
jgi:hypothetical protein